MNSQASESPPDLPSFQPYVVEGFTPNLHVALSGTADPFAFCEYFSAMADAEFKKLSQPKRHEVQDFCHELFATHKYADDATRMALLYRIQRAIIQSGSDAASIWKHHFRTAVTDRGFRDWFSTGKIENANLALLSKYFPVGDPTADELDFAALRIAAGRVQAILTGKKPSPDGRMKYRGIKFPSIQELIFLDQAHKLHEPSDAQLKELARIAHLHEVRKEKRWKSMWIEWGAPFRIVGHVLRQLEDDAQIRLDANAGERQ